MAEVSFTRTELRLLLRAGSLAASVKACPYSPNSTDPAERIRAAAWIRGFVTAHKTT